MFKSDTIAWQFRVKYNESDYFTPLFNTCVDEGYLDAIGKFSSANSKEALEYDEKMEDLYTYGTPVENILFPDEKTAIRYLEKYLAYADEEDVYGGFKLPVEEVTRETQCFRTWSTVGERVPLMVIELHEIQYTIL